MNEMIIEQVREKGPLIHNITNQVVMNFSANGLLAFGASPIMANAKEDAGEIAEVSDALLINLGTITKDQFESMLRAGQAANALNIPVVVDPVGVAASEFRTDQCLKLLKEVQPTVIKGNAGELAHLIGVELKTKGVDFIGDGTSLEIVEIVEKVAEAFQTVVICTGKIDIITDGKRTLKNETGHEMMTRITGAGCLLGSIVAACVSVQENVLESAHAAVSFYGVAAERAATLDTVNGPGTFLPHFLDQLAKKVKT